MNSAGSYKPCPFPSLIASLSPKKKLNSSYNKNAWGTKLLIFLETWRNSLLCGLREIGSVSQSRGCGLRHGTAVGFGSGQPLAQAGRI